MVLLRFFLCGWCVVVNTRGRSFVVVVVVLFSFSASVLGVCRVFWMVESISRCL